ncbi:GntR family transcriptional regulator [Neobacillus niacini]|uniref:GntR family transcriptional regulator n=1 Tax=Neobacillus niacini TaxID=86668 RepID=UPI002862BA4F|nr:GntR family transcriptional regulator [Neobacillus niacini]MDR6998502.1 DNA-binding GntR family transcriptional regulator [Neobacillus niacini]
MKEKTVEKHVYDQIRAAILARQLAPGKQLVEHNISNTLGVSRTPIRNAIKKLSLEGLVDMIPNRGAFVTSPSKEEVVQAYELRANLEYLAVRKAMFVMDENDYLTIKKIIEDEKKSLSNHNSEDFVNANKAFHIAITQKCNNKFLNDFIERLINQTNIYLILFDEFFSNPGLEPYSPNEHSYILELIQNKDEAYLKIALENHFKHSITSIDIRYSGYKDLDEIF